MKLYVTSDFHISHENIMRYCDRYTDSRVSINHYISDLFYFLKGLLKPEDVLLFIGDLACSKDKSINECKRLLELLSCEKHFIRGNHDNWLSDDDLGKIGFNSVRDYLLVNETLFCHYPLDTAYGVFGQYSRHKYLWERFYQNPRIKKIIHGHIHNSPRAMTQDGIERINVSIDAKKSGFTILEFKDYSPETIKGFLNSGSSEFSERLFDL